MLHAMAFFVVIAYDIYLECAYSALDTSWQDDEPSDLWEFRDVMSSQILKYSPLHRKYAGDG